jgi:hypothetical protein
MLKALPISTDGWTTTTDIQPLFFRLTIDSASEFLFGASVNTQLNALPEHVGGLNNADDTAFVNAFENSQDMIARAFRLNDWYSLGLTKEYYETCKVCHDYIDKFVRKVLDNEKRTLLKPDGKEKYVFLEALAAETSNPIEIRDQLLSILVADVIPQPLYSVSFGCQCRKIPKYSISYERRSSMILGHSITQRR